ncbi:MAG: DUF5991 domain-containing protein [Oscillospiraceae bacterium]|nr:DUF5991 domain-containing protein [Oscillospiraceae bacterium]
MKSKTLLIISIILLFIIVFSGCNADIPLDSWLGSYSLTEFIEGIGSPIMMSYEITIYEEDEKYFADIIINGFQTMSRIKATVDGNEESIDLIFDSYLPDNMFEIFEKGDLLLSFSRSGDEIITSRGRIESIWVDNTEQGIYFKKSNITYNQLFYGTWRIAELIPPDLSVPSGRTVLNSDGELYWDFTSILNIEVTFKDNYIKYEGEKHELMHEFETYSLPLFLENDTVNGYYYASSLGISGNYFSVVYFLHPYYQKTENLDENKLNQIYISDLCYLYLKDYNTIYASDSVLIYRLERI